MRLHHVAIKAKDPSTLSRFYADVIGLEERTRFEDAGGLRSVWFGLGDSVLMVERASAGVAPDFDADPPGLHLLALAIEPADAPAWRARVRVLRETAYTLYFADPEGNRIGVSSYPEPLTS